MRAVIACTTLVFSLSIGNLAASQPLDAWSRMARSRTGVTRLSKLTRKSHALADGEKVFRIQRRERGKQRRERRATPASNRLGMKPTKPTISSDEL